LFCTFYKYKKQAEIGAIMISHESQNCIEVLLDLICYEIIRNKLSPEMEALLADHFAECEYCRTKFLNFRQLAEEMTTYIQ
jgi:hypothetical protein